MDVMIWTGAAVSLAGLCAIIWCIVAALAARRARLDDTALRLRLRRVVVVNMAAFATSALGLIIVVAGIALG